MSEKSHGAESMFLIFATTNEKMMEIAYQLRAKVNVKSATSGCQINRFRDFMSEENKLDFEAYVEAELSSGEDFTWSLSLTKTVARWELHRALYRQESHGGVDIGSFEDLSFEEIDTLAEGISSILEELANSAEAFDFMSPPKE